MVLEYLSTNLYNSLSFILQPIIMGWFIGDFIKTKKKTKYIILLTVTFFAADVVTVKFGMLNWIVMVAAYVVVTLLFTIISKVYTLVFLVIGLMLMLLAEIPLVLILAIVSPETIATQELFAPEMIMLRLFSYPMLALVWYGNRSLCSRILPVGNDKRISSYYPFAILEFIIVFVICYSYLPGWYEYSEQQLLSEIVILVAFILLNILLYHTFRDIARNHELEMEQMHAEELIREQAASYARLEENTATIRMLRHDMSNQFQSISYLLDQGEVDTAKRQLAALQDTLVQTGRFTYTGNTVVDAVINLKVPVMEEAAISFHVQGNVPSDCRIAPAVICSMVSNMLDNAIRACGELEAAMRSVELDCGVRNQRLVIRCANTCLPTTMVPDVKRGQATDEHGWGLYIMKMLAERNGGSMVVECENGVFAVTAQLPLKESK